MNTSNKKKVHQLNPTTTNTNYKHRKRLSESEIFYRNEICKLLERSETAVRSYKAAHKFNSYEELYKEAKRRIFIANKLSELLVDKTIHDIKDFFEGTYSAKYERAKTFFMSLYCIDNIYKIDLRFYNNCLIVLQNIKIEKNPCNY